MFELEYKILDICEDILKQKRKLEKRKNKCLNCKNTIGKSIVVCSDQKQFCSNGCYKVFYNLCDHRTCYNEIDDSNIMVQTRFDDHPDGIMYYCSWHCMSNENLDQILWYRENYPNRCNRCKNPLDNHYFKVQTSKNDIFSDIMYYCSWSCACGPFLKDIFDDPKETLWCYEVNNPKPIISKSLFGFDKNNQYAVILKKPNLLIPLGKGDIVTYLDEIRNVYYDCEIVNIVIGKSIGIIKDKFLNLDPELTSDRIKISVDDGDELLGLIVEGLG